MGPIDTAVARRRSPGFGGSAPVPIAVAEPVLDLITGPLRAATVLAAHSAAVILICDPSGSAGPARVVTVLAAEASGVPNGVRTALRATDRPFAGLAAGDAAFVGAGGVRLPGLGLHAVRTVRTAVPRIVAAPAAVTRLADAAQAAPRGVADAPVAALTAALAGGRPAEVRAAVGALLGLGSGSTPGGDDVLCGVLAGLQATGRSVLAQQVAVAALADIDARTPLVSADLLRLAARGHVCTEAAAVLRAVAVPSGRGIAAGAPGVTAPDRAVRRLLAIGHTSGADLATGLAIGLATPAQPAPPRPRTRAAARAADLIGTGRPTSKEHRNR